MKSGNRAVFFTLDYTEKDLADRFRTIGMERAEFGALFDCDCSDAINADYIVKKLAAASRGTLAVIDYLQLLDQRRETPELMAQGSLAMRRCGGSRCWSWTRATSAAAPRAGPRG